MQERLNGYHGLLLRAADLFRAPSSASKLAIQQEASLSVGSRKIPVTADLRGPALELSAILVCYTLHKNSQPFITPQTKLAACSWQW